MSRGRTLKVDPPGDSFAAKLDMAEPGDTILFAAGDHHLAGNHELRRSGRPGSPIVIRAERGATIHGGRQPSVYDLQQDWPNGKPMGAPRLPRLTDWALLKLVGAGHVVLEDLDLSGAWPVILYLTGVRDVVIRRCRMAGGTDAIFIGDSREPDDSRNVDVLDNSWVQDTSPNHRLWHEIDWKDAHGGEGGENSHRYFNGAFVMASNLRKGPTIRGNYVRDAYNGVVSWVTDRMLREHWDEAITLGRGFVIENNTFERIRDNAIEPEANAIDWRVRWNRLIDVHAPISATGTMGRWWYVYGNMSWFVTRPGQPGQGHRTGKAFKLSSEWPFCARVSDVYVFNNSFYLRHPVIAGDEKWPIYMPNLNMWNNVFQFCRPGDQEAASGGSIVCPAEIAYMEHVDWSAPGMNIDFNLSNNLGLRRDTPSHQERHGVVADPSFFADPRIGDFTPTPGSPALRCGKPIQLPLPEQDCMIEIEPKLGAVLADGKLIDVPSL